MSGALDVSSRWELPLLAVNQMQKDVTHNEALARIDLLLLPVVIGAPLNTPPAAPNAGDCWIVGSSPTAAWSGHAGQIAGSTSGGWRWFSVPEGAVVTNRAGARYVRTASGWTAPAAVSEPAGGAVVDSEARAAFAALLTALRAQGVLAPAA
jgi:hypothetical protein